MERPEDQQAQRVWVFHGANARFASGVFASRAEGTAWIATHHLTGILTEYAVGHGAYDLALSQGRFKPAKTHHGTPEHVASFSPGLDHAHFVDGEPG